MELGDPDPQLGLGLGDRTGLPGSIAYLREAHPQGGWRSHGNYGQLAAFWLGVHAGLRDEGARIQSLLRDLQSDVVGDEAFRRTFVPLLNDHLSHLDGHHRIEDQLYFPKFRALDERMVAGFDLLERDHALIHHHLERSVEGARRLLKALGHRKARRGVAADFADRSSTLLDLLDRHLSDEEELIIPAILEHGERAIA